MKIRLENEGLLTMNAKIMTAQNRTSSQK